MCGYSLKQKMQTYNSMLESKVWEKNYEKFKWSLKQRDSKSFRLQSKEDKAKQLERKTKKPDSSHRFEIILAAKVWNVQVEPELAL